MIVYKTLLRDAILFQLVALIVDIYAVMFAIRAWNWDVPGLVPVLVITLIGLSWLAGLRTVAVRQQLRLEVVEG